ncbi:MAG: DUF1553 domain-containing protein [Actinomycetota bacterium]
MAKSRLIGGTGLSLATLLLIAGSHAQAAPRKKAPAKKPVARTVAKKPVAKPAAAGIADVVSLTLDPAGVSLDGPRDLQHLIVTAITKDGATHDVTGQARLTLANPKLVKVTDGVLSPVADGATKLTATYGKFSTKPVDVKVSNAASAAPVEFVNDVMPIMAKGGCNSTACHGSPVGKGGFKLSLFGYEPGEDYQAIAKSSEGKRIDLKKPEQSLLLAKATMAVPHAGGMRFKKDSSEYKVLLAWLSEGAPAIAEFEARVKQVKVYPESPWMPSPKATQRLTVVAEMSDGSMRDVTEKALYSSSDDAIADVSERGLVTAKRGGETAVMIRYLGQVAVSRVAVLPSWKLPASARLPQHNYIDQLVDDKLKKLRMAPSEVCTDEEFVRRAYLDVCGIVPSPDETRAFLSSTDPSKRSKLIDQLLERPEFVDLWTLKWNDTLRNNPRVTRVGAQPFAAWIRDQVAKNVPYDQFVRDIVTASGKTSPMQLDIDNLPRQLARQLEANPGRRRQIEQLVKDLNSREANPPANYYVISRDPLDTTSATSQIFLGVRIECARCHNHPFEKWTQSDFYGLAAFFTGVQARGNNQTPSVVTVNMRRGGPRHPRTNEVVEPKTLDDVQVKVERGEDRRVELAAWMTTPDNPFLAKSLVNRLWGYYFGRGIVEPVDDFRVTNPASNPELLDALAKDFVNQKFDVKSMHRTILNSRTYQQSSRPNQYNREDTSNFARYYPKRLMAEQLFDSISQATGVYLQTGGRGRAQRRPGRYGVQAPQSASRVMQFPTVVSGAPGGAGGANREVVQFLDTFGKPRREAVCECERSPDGNIGQALALINGDEVNGKIASPQGRVQQLVRKGVTDSELVEELYLAALSRRPIPAEMDEANSLLRSSSSKAEGAEDLMWSLLNSREFLFNH